MERKILLDLYKQCKESNQTSSEKYEPDNTGVNLRSLEALQLQHERNMDFKFDTIYGQCGN